MTVWEIHGRELGNCNCDYACPCQFNSLPNDGTCQAAVGYEVETGFYGDVKLDGLRMAATYKWPGAVHEGNGEMQLIIDERATPEQRTALERIMNGEDTEEFATMWFVFSAMAPNKHPTLYRRINIDVDIEERMGSVSIDGVFDLKAEPIKNPVTGENHRVRIDLPNGFEYSIAEIGSGSTKSMGAVELLKINDSYAQFCELHLSNTGVIRDAA